MTVSASDCVAIWRIRCHCHQATAQQRGVSVPGFALTIFRGPLLWLAGRYTPTEVRSPHIYCFVACFAVCVYWGIARLGILVLTAAHSQAAGSAKCMHALTVHLFVVVRLSRVCQGCIVSIYKHDCCPSAGMPPTSFSCLNRWSAVKVAYAPAKGPRQPPVRPALHEQQASEVAQPAHVTLQCCQALDNSERASPGSAALHEVPSTYIVAGRSASPWQAHSPACRNPPSSPVL